MRVAHASNAIKLKELAGQLASTAVAPIPVNQCSRTDHGFNNNKMGHLLIPIDYLEAYDWDPARCLSKFSSFTY